MASGVATGAAVMYWLDPLGGSHRRARAWAGLVHAVHDFIDTMDAGARDIAHRARGLAAEVLAHFREEAVPDGTLVERVRARLGRVCSHPGAVEVTARAGRVELKGPILAREHHLVVGAIAKVRGVQGVVDDLDVHRTAEHIPSLQGGLPVTGERFGPFQENWSPATRLVFFGVGASLVALSLARRPRFRLLVGVGGAGLLLRALTDIDVRRMSGLGEGRSSIEVMKAIQVQAPVRDVFAFWQCFENFPRFMTHVKEVRRAPDGHLHWRVEGPVGASFEWDAEITQMVPNRLLAWKSVGSPMVENAGIVRFDEMPGGATRVTVRLAYHPPGGVAGHAVARLLGADPKREMDDDLLRFKVLIESGRAARSEPAREPAPRQTQPRSPLPAPRTPDGTPYRH